MPTNETFDAVVDALIAQGGVEPGTMFGHSPGLRVSGKFFTFTHKGNAIFKLPRERVEEFVAAGEGAYLDPGNGRLMKGWLVTGAGTKPRWHELAKEARDFVRSDATQKKR